MFWKNLALAVKLIASDFGAINTKNDPACEGLFIERCLCYPGFVAILFYRISHVFWQVDSRWVKLFARIISAVTLILTSVDIHPGAQIGWRFFIDHATGVVIGATAIIGNDCRFYHGVTLGAVTTRQVKRHPTIGNRVVLGCGCVILGDISIGDDCSVGPNVVVRRSMLPGTKALVTDAPVTAEIGASSGAYGVGQ